MSAYDSAVAYARQTLGCTANYGHPRHDEYVALIEAFQAGAGWAHS